MKYDGILSCPSLCLTNQLIFHIFINDASRCVLYYKERNKQITIEYISFLENINIATCFVLARSSSGWL